MSEEENKIEEILPYPRHYHHYLPEDYWSNMYEILSPSPSSPCGHSKKNCSVCENKTENCSHSRRPRERTIPQDYLHSALTLDNFNIFNTFNVQIPEYFFNRDE